MIKRYLKQCEDSLTGSVFSQLLSLPSEVFWQLLRGSCYQRNLPEVAGEPEVQFWPRWDATGTNNSRFIEPDLFLRYSEFDLIIEAKRWDYGQQYQGQWQSQITAYQNEYGEEEKPLHYIALGGLNKEESEEVATDKHVVVTKARWRSLLREIRQYRCDLESHKHTTSQQQAHIRSCEHALELLAWHGFSTGKWYEDFDFSSFPQITYPPPQPLTFSKPHE